MLSEAGRTLRFRTGAGPDNTPPSLADFQFSSFGSPPFEPLPSSCGKSEWVSFAPLGAADDATPVDQLHYDFFFGPTPGMVDLTTASRTLRPQPLIAQGGCSGNNFPVMDTPRISGALAAVDWAGNRSMPTQVRVLRGCGCSSGADLFPFALLGLLVLRRRS